MTPRTWPAASPSSRPKRWTPGGLTGGVISGSNQGSKIAAVVAWRGRLQRVRENSAHVMPNASRTRSRASDPFLKTVRPMKSPVGAPNTWPVPVAIDARLAHQPEDRVAGAERDREPCPREPGRCRSGCTGCRPTRRRPARPGDRSASASTAPACRRSTSAGRIGGSFAASPGAVASTAGGHHVLDDRSMRFMPEPSPGSIGACPPINSEARNELTRWTRSVAA